MGVVNREMEAGQLSSRPPLSFIVIITISSSSSSSIIIIIIIIVVLFLSLLLLSISILLVWLLLLLLLSLILLLILISLLSWALDHRCPWKCSHCGHRLPSALNVCICIYIYIYSHIIPSSEIDLRSCLGCFYRLRRVRKIGWKGTVEIQDLWGRSPATGPKPYKCQNHIWNTKKYKRNTDFEVDMSWHGMARHGTARHSTAWHGIAWYDI